MKTKLISMSRLAKFAFWVEALSSQLAGFMIQFFTPIAPFVALTTFLVFADQFTGRRAAMTSRGMFRTVEKLTLYLVVIFAAEAVYRVMIADTIPTLHITYGVMAQIAGVELKSNIENVNSANGANININVFLRMFTKK
jgi:hypothetical protein